MQRMDKNEELFFIKQDMETLFQSFQTDTSLLVNRGGEAFIWFFFSVSISYHIDFQKDSSPWLQRLFEFWSS